MLVDLSHIVRMQTSSLRKYSILTRVDRTVRTSSVDLDGNIDNAQSSNIISPNALTIMSLPWRDWIHHETYFQ